MMRPPSLTKVKEPLTRVVGVRIGDHITLPDPVAVIKAAAIVICL